MKYLSRSMRIPSHWYLPSQSNFGARYATKFLVEYTNPLTGERKEIQPWVKHTHLEEGFELADMTQEKTREELESVITDVMEPESPRFSEVAGWKVTRMMPLYGIVNPYFS